MVISIYHYFEVSKNFCNSTYTKIVYLYNFHIIISIAPNV